MLLKMQKMIDTNLLNILFIKYINNQDNVIDARIIGIDNIIENLAALIYHILINVLL